MCLAVEADASHHKWILILLQAQLIAGKSERTFCLDFGALLRTDHMGPQTLPTFNDQNDILAWAAEGFHSMPSQDQAHPSNKHIPFKLDACQCHLSSNCCAWYISLVCNLHRVYLSPHMSVLPFSRKDPHSTCKAAGPSSIHPCT